LGERDHRYLPFLLALEERAGAAENCGDEIKELEQTPFRLDIDIRVVVGRYALSGVRGSPSIARVGPGPVFIPAQGTNINIILIADLLAASLS
jgi:hypothetical protein